MTGLQLLLSIGEILFPVALLVPSLYYTILQLKQNEVSEENRAAGRRPLVVPSGSTLLLLYVTPIAYLIFIGVRVVTSLDELEQIGPLDPWFIGGAIGLIALGFILVGRYNFRISITFRGFGTED